MRQASSGMPVWDLAFFSGDCLDHACVASSVRVTPKIVLVPLPLFASTLEAAGMTKKNQSMSTSTTTPLPTKKPCSSALLPEPPACILQVAPLVLHGLLCLPPCLQDDYL